MMIPAEQTPTTSHRLGRGLAVGTIVILLTTAALSRAGESASGPAMDFGSILGPGSSIEADGEMTFLSTPGGELDRYRAQKNVRIVTRDLHLECEDFLFDFASGTITADGTPSDVVKITLRNVNIGGSGNKKSNTRATCRHYVFYIKERRHVLSMDPVLYLRGKGGNETAITGDTISISQDEQGRWLMLVAPGKQGGTKFFDTSRKKSTMTMDAGAIDRTRPLPLARPGTSPEPKPAAAKPTRIDEGNVQKLKPVKPPKVTKIEEGG